jgi:LysR family transcriptional regulator, hydrogen peroxide-inducible genes activator
VNLTQLEYVVALDEHRHFSRAARSCGVTQPTLSTQLAKLEHELGVEIFDRDRQPVEPTDLGRRIVDQARQVLREAGRFEEVILEARGVVAGDLRVGILPTLAPYLLPRFVSDLAQRHPGISLEVEELVTEQILQGLDADRLDLGVIATSDEKRGWIEQELFEEPFVGYMAPGHPLLERDRLRREDLQIDDLWLLQEGHCFRDQILELCEDLRSEGAGRRSVTFRSGNLETLKQMVNASGGMTLLPSLAVQSLKGTERDRVRPFVEPSPARIVRLVRRKTYLKRGLIEAFTAVLLQALSVGGVRSLDGP